MTEREARITAEELRRWSVMTCEEIGCGNVQRMIAHLQAAERDRDAAREALERTRDRLVKTRYTRGQCPFCGQSPHRGDCLLIPILDDIRQTLTPTPPPEEDAR